MEKPTMDSMFKLLRMAVFQSGEILTREEKASLQKNLPALYSLSSSFDIAHLFYAVLLQQGVAEPGNETLKSFQKKQFSALSRYGQMQSAFSLLCPALEAAKIPFVPLKGAVMRSLYPEPWMRTSCDIDVLIQKEDLPAATECLEAIGYQKTGSSPHDVSLYSPEGVHVELHFDLVEEKRANNAHAVLSKIDAHASLVTGSKYHYQLDDEMFYFYHLAHMAKHVETGGCGIRPFLDLFILENLKEKNENARRQLLKDGNLAAFAGRCTKLCRVWFGKEQPDEISTALEAYILTGGIYGDSERSIVVKQRKKGKIGYILSRIFPSFAYMKKVYPVLQKCPPLLPFCYFLRFFKLFSKKNADHAAVELKAAQNQTGLASLFEELGL